MEAPPFSLVTSTEPRTLPGSEIPSFDVPTPTEGTVHDFHHHTLRPTCMQQNKSSLEGKVNPVEITLQPTDCTVEVDARACFKCEARLKGGLGEPNFLWYKDSEPLVGEINEEYVIDGTTEQDAGVYFCLISDPSERHFKKTENVRLTLITHGRPEGGLKVVLIFMRHALSTLR